MSQDKNSEQKPKLNLIFWITLIRGFLVVILGISLLFIPEKTKAMLFNFMGFFWLMTGIVSVRQELHTKGHRWVLIAGILGILAGCSVVTRNFTRQYVGEFWIAELLGAVILLTGIVHILGGFQIGGKSMHGRTELSILLGVFEVFLGGALILYQGGDSPVLYTVAIIWALLGGILLLSDAYRQYRASKSAGSQPVN